MLLLSFFMFKEEYNPKHTPIIEVKKENEVYEIIIEVGKEVKHPNELTHGVQWIDVYFKPEEKELVHLARVEFRAHGEFNVFTEPKVRLYAKLGKGKIIALAYCNLHGVWKAEKEVE